MSDVVYKITIDDQELIQGFKNHEIRSEETGQKVSKSYENATKEIDKTTQSTNSLTSSFEKLNNTIDVFGKLTTSLTFFKNTQDIIAIITPLMDSYGVTLEDLVSPLEKIGVNTQIFADNLRDLNLKINQFIENPTKETIDNLKLSLIALVASLNQFEKGLLKITQDIKDFTSSIMQSLNPINLMATGFITLVASLTGVISSFISIIAYGFLVAGVMIMLGKDSIRQMIVGFNSWISIGKSLIQLLQQMWAQFSYTNLGIMGLGLHAEDTAIIFTQLQFVLATFNNSLTQVAQVVLGVGSIFSAVVGIAITELIIGIGKLATWLGNTLVEASIKATETFNKLSTQTIILTAVIDGVNRAFNKTASIENYVGLVNDLATNFNLSTLSLQKATQELVLVGANLGYTTDQTKDLIKVVAQYAKINHTDVYDAAVSFGSALNGNSQSVMQYGVKLTAANNQHYMFANGSTKIFEKLSDEEKALIRLSNLFKQFSVVSGVAYKASQAFGDSVNRSNVLMERLLTIYGEGAAVVEQFYLKNYLLNIILENINYGFIRYLGTVGALAGRILQVIGFFVEWSIKIFLVTKGIQLLKTLLESQFWAQFATKTLPLINTSIQAFANNLAGATVNLTSFKGVAEGFINILRTQVSTILKGIGLASTASVGFGAILSGIGMKFATWFSTIYQVISPLFPIILRVAGAIALVYAGVKFIINIFEELENRTEIFSTIWNVFVTEFERSSGVFAYVKDVITGVFNGILDFGNRVFGFIISSILAMVTPLVYAMRMLGQKFISKESYNQLVALEDRLNSLQGSLIASSFSLKEFGTTISASTEKAKKLGEAVNMNDIVSLMETLKDVGKTQLQIIDETLKARKDLITRAYQQELIQQSVYLKLLNLAIKDNQIKRNEEIKSEMRAYYDVLKKMQNDNGQNEIEKLNRESADRIKIIKDMEDKHFITKQDATKNLLQNEKYYNQELAKLVINQQTTWSMLGDAITAEFNNIGITMQDVAKEIKKALIDGIGSSFQWLGKSLADHEASWQDLQKNVGKILSGLCSMLGNMFIAIGIAQNATPILGLSGGAAIAAGLGLHVLAGALGTMGGGTSGSSAANTASSGVQSNGPDLTSIPEKISNQERQQPNPVLNITINGDVLDSDQSGMRIVQLINDAFDRKGVILRQGAYA